MIQRGSKRFGSQRTSHKNRSAILDKPASVYTFCGIEIPVPPKIIRKILRRNSLEPANPAFEPRIISIDVVDMDGTTRLVFRMRRHDPQGDLMLSGKGAIGASAVREQFSINRQSRQKHFANIASRPVAQNNRQS